jgi:arabinogalactan endo-1,4-beta-galactosidase
VQASLNSLAKAYAKPIIVAETAFPWADDGGGLANRHLAWRATPQGQKQFLMDLIDAVNVCPRTWGWAFSGGMPNRFQCAIRL